MRITFLSHEFPPIGGGAATALDALSGELNDLGHDVQVISIGLNNKVDILNDYNGRQCVLLAAGRRSTIAPTTFELLQSLSVLFFRSRSYIAQFKPEVIVAFFVAPAGLAATGLAARSHTPLIVSVRGSDISNFSVARWKSWKLLQTFISRLVLRRAAVITTNGVHLKKLVHQSFGVDIKKYPSVVSLANGVNPLIFTPRLNLDLKDKLRLLYVGQLIDRKGLEFVLDAFEQSSVVQNSCSLTIAGSGPLEQTIEHRIRTTPQITFIGHCDRDQLPEIYRSHDLLVHLSSAEGVSNVLLEACASGLAILATEEAIDSSLAVHAKIISNREDVDEISQSIEYLLANPKDLYRQKKLNRCAATSMAWTKIAADWIKILEQARRTRSF